MAVGLERPAHMPEQVAPTSKRMGRSCAHPSHQTEVKISTRELLKAYGTYRRHNQAVSLLVKFAAAGWPFPSGLGLHTPCTPPKHMETCAASTAALRLLPRTFCGLCKPPAKLLGEQTLRDLLQPACPQNSVQPINCRPLSPARARTGTADAAALIRTLKFSRRADMSGHTRQDWACALHARLAHTRKHAPQALQRSGPPRSSACTRRRCRCCSALPSSLRPPGARTCPPGAAAGSC